MVVMSQVPPLDQRSLKSATAPSAVREPEVSSFLALTASSCQQRAPPAPAAVRSPS